MTRDDKLRHRIIKWMRANGSDIHFGAQRAEVVKRAEEMLGLTPPPPGAASCTLKGRFKTVVKASHAKRATVERMAKPVAQGRAKSACKKRAQKQPAAAPDRYARFYKSGDWKRARYDALKAADGRCCLCGASPAVGAILNVDHIKPLRKHWDLRLDPDNLQVLCGSCNHGKGNRDDTDWREPRLAVLMGEGVA